MSVQNMSANPQRIYDVMCAVKCRTECAAYVWTECRISMQDIALCVSGVLLLFLLADIQAVNRTDKTSEI